MSLVEKIKSSAKELSSLQVIVACGMLLALRVVLGCFANFTLAFLPSVKIGLGFAPIAISAIMFGPVPAAIIGALGDVISYIITPMGEYFPGWTLNGFIIGFLWGVFLYKQNILKPQTFLVRVIICRIIIAFFPEITLGALWLNISLGLDLKAMALTRLTSQLVFIPLETIVVYSLSFAIKPLNKIIKRKTA